MTKSGLTLRTIPVESTLVLRQKLLRPHQAVSDCLLSEDENRDAHHFGAYIENELVGVCSIYPGEAEFRGHWRLRMMATKFEVRRRGIGKQLVEKAEQFLVGRNAVLLWCNARESAVGFYLKLGFVIEGEKFYIEDVGPHFKMTMTVTGSG